MKSRKIPKGYTLVTIAVLDEEKEKENLEEIKKMIEEHRLKRLIDRCIKEVKIPDRSYRENHLKFSH